MRITALALLTLLGAACASRDGFIDERNLGCGSGQDVSVDVALNIPGVASEATSDNLTMVVEVGNNSTSDIEVVSIRVEPGQGVRPRYRIERSFREFHRVLTPGSDAAFELPVSGRGVAAGPNNLQSRGDDTMPIIVSVYLASGDNYRCRMDIPAPRV
jgi:hypothetical protein